MRGQIINNPRLEFLAPALERWGDCIDRFNQFAGDAEAPYWHGAAANTGLLAAAAWQAELAALQQFAGKKQRDEGEYEGRCDLSISSADEALYLSVSQRWPKIARLDMADALQQTAALARQVAYPSQLKAGALFISPWKAGQHASPEDCRTWSTTCRNIPPVPSPGTSRMPTASCTTSWGSIFRGWRCCSSRLEAT